MHPCPNCGSANSVPIGGILRCADCQQYFQPAAETTSAQLLPAGQAQAYLEQKNLAGTSRLRAIAENWLTLSLIAVLIGILVLAAGLFTQTAWAVTAGSALTGAGFWFYLTGQLVHIRANTEK